MNSPLPRIVIVGATSSIAEHCARLWVQRGPVALTLVGRDTGRLRRVADDLAVRSPTSRIQAETVDFLDPSAISALTQRCAEGGALDIVLIAHGSLPDQGACEQDDALAREALDVNGVSPVLFAQAFARSMGAAGRGTLAVIGSVAGDRGRRKNYVYGAAKAMVDRCAQGLQHRFAGTGVKVVLVKPGPTDTPMTSQLKARGARLASVEQVAGDIVRGIERGQRVVYTPGKWRVIMGVIRHLPSFIFDRLDI